MAQPRTAYRSFTYPEEYDEKECDEFINHFVNLGIFLAMNHLKNSRKYFGKDVAITAAYEGCFRAYLVSKKLNAIEYKFKKGLVRKCVRECFWTLARMFGYIPTSGQIFFPTAWINFEDYFKEQTINSTTCDEVDHQILRDLIDQMPDKERDIFILHLSGYDYAEIARKLGYKGKTTALKIAKKKIRKLALQFS